MRVPISWLREYVSVEATTEEIAERLTMAGIEVDAVDCFGAFHPSIVVGEIESSTPHGDRELYRVSVRVKDGAIEVISGAPNLSDVSSGTKVAVALPGAVVLDPSAPFATRTIERAKLYGVESAGALCSPRELGIGEDHSGVLFLADDCAVGRPVIEFLQVDSTWSADEVLELAILPNTARCMAIVGVAREVAALFASELKHEPPVGDLEPSSGPLDPTIKAPEMCRNFTVAELTGLDGAATPDWMVRKLALCGVEAIHPVVDTLNYVMFEVGQPMHAYDAARLPSTKLAARAIRPGEKMRTLAQADDDEPLLLPEGLLAITSEDAPVALAGVMGGNDCKVTDGTSRVLLESANFDYISIRRSQSASKLFTEASARYSRGVDPVLSHTGLRRALYLLTEMCPNLTVEGMGDTGEPFAPPRVLSIAIDEANSALGTQLSGEEIIKLLEPAGIQARLDGGRVEVTVTSAREDLQLECDLMEEIARLGGFDRMPETMPVEPVPMHQRDASTEMREAARDALVGYGLQELLSYTLSSPELEANLQLGRQEECEPQYVRILNPTTSERTAMRRTLVPGALAAMARNLRFVPGVWSFELGPVFHPEKPASDSELLPSEPTRVVIAIAGAAVDPSLHDPKPRTADFYDLTDAIRYLCHHLHVPAPEFRAANVAPYHPGICAEVSVGGVVLGNAGALHPTVAEAFDLAGHQVFAAELDGDALIEQALRDFSSDPIPRYPGIEVDISVVANSSMASADLVQIARDAAIPEVAGVTVFDVYKGIDAAGDVKSVGLRLTLLAADRTLTMEEGRAIRDQIAAALRQNASVTIRE